ncbi:unnamed protein product [Nezara viridula]|uniref:Uncharacterized protein n=1 Tax=Nezara viridula TaxID=85310 RepID=A0A9P0MPL5_NEZVI|nr:unnamed protein product [Nezara viridula]
MKSFSSSRYCGTKIFSPKGGGWGKRKPYFERRDRTGRGGLMNYNQDSSHGATSKPPSVSCLSTNSVSCLYHQGFRSSSQGQVNSAVAAKEHSRVHFYLGLTPRKH